MENRTTSYGVIFRRTILPVLTISLLSLSNNLFAKGAGTSSALTLLESPSSRAAALAEAFTAGTNDIGAFGYNPASLNSLETGQASFLYQKGSFEDAFAHLSLGTPIRGNRGVGFSVGYYNGGEIELFDGTDTKTLTVQQDILVTAGFAQKIGPANVGVTGKYFSSELIETEKAQAYAADFGLSMPINSRIQLGLAGQNFGTQLKFVEEGNDLPRIARAGLALNLVPQGYKTTLLLDAPYHLNEEELRPAVGLEINYGLLSIRGGYRPGNDLEEFSVGTGFLIGSSSLDYSFGMVEELDARHRVSLSMRFGTGPSAPVFVKKDKPAKAQRRVVMQLPEEEPVVHKKKRMKLGGQVVKNNMGEPVRRIYKIQEGDTLKHIAFEYYGDSNKWKKIFQANRHLLEDPVEIGNGQRIIIPY